MTVLSIDFAWQQISPDDMLRAGYLGGAFRYVSHDGSKDATPVEIANDHAKGLPITFMYESTAQRSLDGKQAGKDDANFFNDRLAQLGAPASCLRCTTTDFDGGDECLPYYEGWAEVNRALRRGAYESGYLIRRCKQLGLIDIGWQTMSTGFTESTPVNRKYVDILQRFPTRDMPPHPRSTWDENEIYVADWGAWWPPGFGPTNDEEEEMIVVKPGEYVPLVVRPATRATLRVSVDQPGQVRLAWGPNGKVSQIRDKFQVAHITRADVDVTGASWASVQNQGTQPVAVTLDYS